MSYLAFAQAVRPPEDLPLREWGAKWVKLIDGRTPFYDPHAAPWQHGTLIRFEDMEARQMNLLWPTGSGKSVLFEVVLSWVLSESPRSVQCSHQTDRPAARWVERRVWPTLQGCEPCKPIIAATHRHKTRKLEMLFPNGCWFLFGGANMRNLQDVSVPWVLGQEVWDWPPGSIGQAKARDHDRPDAKAVFCGQGGLVGSEFFQECEQGQLVEFQYKCPHCKKRSPWILRTDDARADFKAAFSWNTEAAEAERVDWPKLLKSVRFVAPCCGHRFTDTVKNRRRLAASGEDVVHPGPAVPGWTTHTFTAASIWWVPWQKLVRQFVLAWRAELLGDSSKMRDFIQKRMARFWSEEVETPTLDTEENRYSKADFWPTADLAPKWENEVVRLMTVDVQKDHFWGVVRAWSIAGDSRLLWEGRISTIELVRELQSRFQVPNNCVGIDAGYLPDTVAGWRWRYRDPVVRDGKQVGFLTWIMFKGDQVHSYPHSDKIRRVYSPSIMQTASDNTPYQLTKFSNSSCKDTLAALMTTPARQFGVFHDHSEAYGKQMASEHKKETTPGRWRWVPVRAGAANHLWDCETMGVALAAMKRILAPTPPGDEDSQGDGNPTP